MVSAACDTLSATDTVGDVVGNPLPGLLSAQTFLAQAAETGHTGDVVPTWVEAQLPGLPALGGLFFLRISLLTN